MIMPFHRSSLVALVVTLTLAACGGDNGVTVTEINSVAVSPGTATLVSLGATQQLFALASAAGTLAPDATFTWSSSDASVASVSATGLVTALANGTTTVTASVTGATATGSATITVAQAAAAITLTIADETITPGATTQVMATVVDAGGSNLSAPDLTWSSSDPTIATVDNTGLVTGVAEGQVVVTASQDGASGTVGAGVLRPDLVIVDDQTLGGTVAVGTMSVAAGVIVTLTEDVVIDASGPVTIAGTVTGDCVALEINGQDAITVSGTLADDGTVTATGQGTVAGTPNIKVAFAGTYDKATQTLQGTYSMDTESVISPGHPVVYNVDVTGGSE